MPSVIQTRTDNPISVTKDPALQPLGQAAVRQRHKPSLLQASPYSDPEHLLDLSSLGQSQQLLAIALKHMKTTPKHELDFSTAPYVDSFNWEEVVQELQHLVVREGYHWQRQHFYVVIFRSQLPSTTDRHELGKLDRKAHQEATASGGLLKYWFGVPDSAGRNLATCIWRAQSDLGPASMGPGHKEAMRKTRNMYLEWKVEHLRFTIEDDASGWSMQDCS